MWGVRGHWAKLHHSSTSQQRGYAPPCLLGSPPYLTAVVLKEAEERVEMYG